MLVKTQFNREQHPCNYEQNELPSMTVPDQTMSIRTILERHSRGLPISQNNQPQYDSINDEYNDMPDIRNMDLADRAQFIENAKQELDDIKNQINQKYPKKTSGVQGDEIPATPPEKGADGTEAQKNGNEIA